MSVISKIINTSSLSVIKKIYGIKVRKIVGSNETTKKIIVGWNKTAKKIMVGKIKVVDRKKWVMLSKINCLA